MQNEAETPYFLNLKFWNGHSAKKLVPTGFRNALGMRNRSRQDMKNPKPDLKSSECEFSISVEISDLTEISTVVEISMEFLGFRKS